MKYIFGSEWVKKENKYCLDLEDVMLELIKIDDESVTILIKNRESKYKLYKQTTGGKFFKYKKYHCYLPKE